MNNQTATAKHTPGPWTILGEGILIDPRNGGNIGTTRIETSLGEIEIVDGTNEPDYNARLIAAAPELLAALEMAVKELDARLELIGMSGQDVPAMQCRAAIAKAKGE